MRDSNTQGTCCLPHQLQKASNRGQGKVSILIWMLLCPHDLISLSYGPSSS